MAFHTKYDRKYHNIPVWYIPLARKWNNELSEPVPIVLLTKTTYVLNGLFQYYQLSTFPYTELYGALLNTIVRQQIIGATEYC